MFKKMANLKCRNGHLHFAPNPTRWSGMACGTRRGTKPPCKRQLEVIHQRTGYGTWGTK